MILVSSVLINYLCKIIKAICILRKSVHKINVCLSCVALLATMCLISMASASFPQDGNVDARAYSNQRKYKLVWQDNFSGRHLDSTKWSKIKRNVFAWNCHMSTDPSVFNLRKGYLRLYCKRNANKGDTARVITGGITTEDKYPITYGKVEVRARLKGATGCWPAIWLASCKQASTDPKWAEIDIIERYNHRQEVVMTAHNYWGTTLKKQTDAERNVTVKVRPESWNVYAVEILPNCLIFSVNGKDVKVYKRIPNVTGQFPYGIEKYLRIDMQWGNPWLKELRENELPAYMDIDWVKVSELAN